MAQATQSTGAKLLSAWKSKVVFMSAAWCSFSVRKFSNSTSRRAAAAYKGFVSAMKTPTSEPPQAAASRGPYSGAMGKASASGGALGGGVEGGGWRRLGASKDERETNDGADNGDEPDETWDEMNDVGVGSVGSRMTTLCVS